MVVLVVMPRDQARIAIIASILIAAVSGVYIGVKIVIACVSLLVLQSSNCIILS